MSIQKIGFFLLSIFLFLGCVQDSEKKVEKKIQEELNSEKSEEQPSYEKYQKGLENLHIN